VFATVGTALKSLLNGGLCVELQNEYKKKIQKIAIINKVVKKETKEIFLLSNSPQEKVVGRRKQYIGAINGSS
jgi:hypothetical protein